MKQIARLMLFLLLCTSTAESVWAQNVTIAQGGTVTGCAGNFYDSGGQFGNYGPNENHTLTICPDLTIGDKLQIDFSFFNLGIGDQLSIYDGSSTASTLVGVFTTNPGTVIASNLNTSGCLTFVFASNNIQQTQGWAATASCLFTCQQVESVISSTTPATEPAPDSIYINICAGDSVTFNGSGFYPQNDSIYNQSDATSTFAWDFGDGNSSTLQNPTHTFNAVGGWRTRLYVTDSNGCLGVPTDIKVRVAPPPTFDGTEAIPDSVCAGDSVTLFGLHQRPTGLFAPAGIVAGTTFLPDGTGTSYETTITISSFLSTDTVSSISDISEVCAVMEHSFLGDLKIELICPDNTAITLKQNPGGGGIYLGEPVDDNSTTPGTGWNYCWNSNPTFGTMNTESGGGCPNCINLTSPPSPDPGNSLPAGSYQSVDPLSDLIGCPLNGNWTIKVTDFLGSDNGYIFSWELKFDTSLVSTEIFYVDTDSVSWSGNDIVQTIDDSTVIATPVNPGQQNYTFTVYNEYGCAYDTTIGVFVRPNSTVNFGWEPVCVGDSMQFTDSSSASQGVISSWSWNFGDGSPTDTTQNPKHQYDSAGYYSVTLEVNTDLGCSSTITIDSVQVLDLPDAGFSFGNVCFGDTVFFTDTSSILSDTVNQWYWDFADGDTSILQNPFHIFPNDTLYEVILVATSSEGCRDTVKNWVNNYQLPIPQFNLNNACATDSVTFTESSLSPNGSPLLDWQWDFENDGINDTLGQQVKLSFVNAGNYTVKLTVTDSLGCTDTASQLMVIHPLPIADFNAANVCLGDSMAFTDVSSVNTGNIVSWSWDFGDGSPINTDQNPVHLFADTGIYQVTLSVVTDSGCSNANAGVFPVEVYKLPVADFGFTNVCFGDTMFFQDSSTTLSGTVNLWHWNFGDGDTAITANTQHLFLQDTLFEVKLAVQSDLGCRDTVSQWINNYQLPVPAFTANNACAFDTVFYTDQSATPNGSPLTTWRWDFENNGVFDDSTATVQDTNSIFGTYSVLLQVTDSLGCMDTASQPVVVHPLPTALLGTSPVCFGDTMFFSNGSSVATGAVVSWSWDFGDGIGTSMAQQPFYTYSDTGLYTITLDVVTDSGCQNAVTATQLVEVYNLPFTNFGFTDVCFGDTMFFQDSSSTLSGSVASWTWAFGDGDTSLLQNPAHVFPQDTLFEVTLAVESNLGCKDTISKWVNNYELPIVSIGFSNTCQETSGTFTDQSIGYQNNPIVAWSWDIGATGVIDDTLNQTTAFYAQNGTFPVQLTVTDSLGCANTGTDSIIINPKPVADFASSNVCLGAPTLFFDSSTVATGSINEWIWTFGDGTPTDSIFNPQHNYPAAGTYPINYVVISDSSCSDTISGSITIVVFPLPDPAFDFNLTCLDDSTHFLDQSTISVGTIDSWLWVFGENGATSNQQNPAFLYSDTGNYEVSLLATSNNGCTRILKDTIDVQPLPVVNYGFTNHCFDDSATFTNQSTIVEGSIQSYFWDFASGQSSTVFEPTHLFPTAGLIPVKLIATADSTGCQDSLTQLVTVYDLPNVNFIVQNVCEDSLASFTDGSSATNGSGLASWAWDYDLNGTTDETVPNPDTVFTLFGTQQVQLIVTDSLGCRDSLTKTLIIHPNPVAKFGFQNVCFQNTMPFTDSSTVATGNIDLYTWNFGDASPTANGNQVNHLYAADGTYPVLLQVETDKGCRMTTDTQLVVVYPKPVADFSALPECEYDSVDFKNSSTINTPGNLTQWVWDFDDGDSAFTISATHQFPSFGYYNVSLIAISANGCTDTTSEWMQIFATPDANFSVATVCQGDSFQFQNNSVNLDGLINSNVWAFVEPDSSLLANPWYTFDSVGSFPVTLVVTSEHLCIDSVSKSVVVSPKPVALFDFEPACAGDAMVFKNQSYGLNGDRIDVSQWYFGDGSDPSVKANPEHIYADGQFYDVLLRIETDKGCWDTLTKEVQVYRKPIPDFTAFPTEGCSDLPVFFENQSFFDGGGPLTYSWMIGDDTNAYTDKDLPYLFQNVSDDIESVSVRLTVSSPLCSNTIKVDDVVQVWPKPRAQFVAQPQQVSVYDGEVFFENRSQFGIWNTWYFDDQGITSVERDPSYLYQNAGNYNVQLVVENDFACVDTATQLISILPEISYYIPNAFSPNGDGINDFFSGVGEAYSTEFEFRIFDRWGNQVFFTRNPDAQWNGSYKGRPAQQGVYVYHVTFIDEVNQKEVVLSGEVTLLRPQLRD